MEKNQSKTPDQNLIQKLVDICKMAKKNGADAADAVFSEGTSTTLKTERGTISELKVSGSRNLGLRLFKGQKITEVASEDLSTESINYLLSNALASMHYLNDDKDQSPLQTRSSIKLNVHAKNCGTDLQGQGKKPWSMAEKREKILAMESSLLGESSLVKNVPYNTWVERQHHSYLVTQDGPISYQASDFAQIYSSCLLEDGPAKCMTGHHLSGRNLELLPFNEFAPYIVKRGERLLHSHSLPSGQYTVIFEPDIFADLFLSFGTYWNGKSTVEGLNPWKEKRGQQVAKQEFNFLDVPRHPEAFHHYMFDDEGLDQSDVPIIQNGTFQNILHNSKTSKILGVPNNARASRGPGQPLNVSGTNKIITAGKATKSDLYQGKVLLVMEEQGMHSGLNAVSGQFSFGARGIILNNGVPEQAFNDITVSGNINEMLKSDFLLGDKILPDTSHHFFAPEMRFNKMSISGSAKN